MVNADITKAHPEAQKYCEVIGFDWLYEPRTLEDSQLTVRLEFCKHIKIQIVCYLFQEGLRLFKGLCLFFRFFHFIISLTLGLNGQTSFEYSTTNYVDPAFNTPPDSWKYVPSCEGPRIGSK